MLVLSAFETKILFRNCEHKPDHVRKGQYLLSLQDESFQERGGRQNGFSFFDFSRQRPFLKRSVGTALAESWETFTAVSGDLGGPSVKQTLEGQQKYGQREWPALRGLPAVPRVGQSRTFCKRSECPLPMLAAGLGVWSGSAEPSWGWISGSLGQVHGAFSPHVKKLAEQWGPASFRRFSLSGGPAGLPSALLCGDLLLLFTRSDSTQTPVVSWQEFWLWFLILCMWTICLFFNFHRLFSALTSVIWGLPQWLYG